MWTNIQLQPKETSPMPMSSTSMMLYTHVLTNSFRGHHGLKMYPRVKYHSQRALLLDKKLGLQGFSGLRLSQIHLDKTMPALMT